MIKILIAEKDIHVSELIEARLRARNYETVILKESAEVLRQLERDRFDLVLISSDMDLIDGKRLMEHIRFQTQHWHIPVILMTEESRISELILSKDHGYDDFLIKPFNALALQLRIAMNIAKVKQRVDANALTHLPGNHSIERIILDKIQKREPFSVLYLDINHFKSFNDRYGFQKGDTVLRQTARILVQIRMKMDLEKECFIGHIGGDDFIAVLTPEKEEVFARSFIEEFDRIIPTYYNEDDRKRGCIRTKNRRGKFETVPLMACSVAACSSLDHDYKNLGEIAQDAAAVKGFLKSQPGSHYLRDRRGSPIQDIEKALEVLNPELEKEKEREKRRGKAELKIDPLGQTLINAGLISQEQLSDALKRHFETGRRLGQVLIDMRAVKSEDVGRMLEKKLNVRYVSLKHFSFPVGGERLLPASIIKAHRIVPLQVSMDHLKVGMCDPFDLKTLDMIEKITGLKPEPYLMLESEFETFSEKYTDGAAAKEKAG
ncbi:MAG: hypothetical protein A2Z83_05035 [Omnitrophica bacterium GWA2_52_8]|nr:MAG: hypothetical protein A2Z83_05035 [Omnitrophica bacterium GWA2_52_8]